MQLVQLIWAVLFALCIHVLDFNVWFADMDLDQPLFYYLYYDILVSSSFIVLVL